MKKIILTGATGYIGTHLVDSLIKEGYNITVLSRDPKKQSSTLPSGVKLLKWDYNVPEKWTDQLNSNEIIIHLAGANIFGKRWNYNYKKMIVDSREKSTLNITNSISKYSCVKLFISASGIGYYGDTGNIAVDESGNNGTDFLAEVCQRWEKPSHGADSLGIRRVNMRMGLVFSTKEGYLNKLLPTFRMFIGGPLGSKENWLSWVHIDDLVNAYLFAIRNESIKGAVNITSPEPVKMGEFASALGSVMNRPSIFQVPEFALRIAVGEGGKYVTMSQRVLPSVLQKSGFQFKYPELKTALKDLIKNKK